MLAEDLHTVPTSLGDVGYLHIANYPTARMNFLQLFGLEKYVRPRSVVIDSSVLGMMR
jgi:hypothetical protein